MKKYLCIDIGGTSVKYAVVNDDGKILRKSSVPSEAKIPGGILKNLGEIIEKNRDGAEGAAISTAGLVDSTKGEVIFAGGNFAAYSGAKLKKFVEEKYNLPCEVENDANAAALGEYWLGGGKGNRSLFMMVVGTGLGGAFVTEGKILSGANFGAGEIGFLPASSGKLEDAASVAALIKFVTERKKIPADRLDGEKIIALAKEGDEDALLGARRMAKALAEGAAAASCLLNPAVILLGGGIMEGEKASPFIIPMTEEFFAALLPLPMRKNTVIKVAALGNDAALLGALKSFLDKR